MAKWKDPGERGDFGAWLTAQVGDRTYDWLAEEMAKRGEAHGASYYRAMAGGSKPPGRAIRRALMEYFGGGPAPEDAEAESADVAAAIDRQTAVLRELVGELRASRAEGRGQATATMDALAWIAGQLRGDRTGAGSAAEDAPPPPVRSAG